ncbi:DUF1294 domain-containing protein [Paenibacillus sp. Y412MC10]|uniref:DUF1294 domain-containing protein n=1 Tax=Geobacillus sp. (strain Y412MC10) TaxID=481743 RepID=UPI0011AB86A9|nr:DUF1294 domain-containing protein [Paenibacillus sp. Y412MC10]
MMITIAYIAAINLIGFLMMGYDKKQAIRGARRIPEKNLFFISFIGGALGSFLGMRKFRHKTKHQSFVIGIPFLIVVNVVVLGYMLLRF